MKVCKTCGTQNEDVFTRCVACGADLENEAGYSQVGDDEATVLLDPMDDQNKQSFTIKRDENTYGQTPAGNGMSGQMSPGMQYGYNNGMPQNYNAGMNYQSQPQMQGGMPNGGYNQNAGGWNQNPSTYQSQPVKSNKKMIFIALGVMVAVTALALFLIFGLGKGGRGGQKSPEAVAETFIEAMNDRDTKTMESLCPPFLDPNTDDIKDSLDSLDMYDMEFKFDEVTDTYDYDSDDIDDLEADIEDEYGVDVSIAAACEVEFDFELSGNYFGETYTETQSESILAIKYKGKWYLYE